jgi:hypothetical protein
VAPDCGHIILEMGHLEICGMLGIFGRLNIANTSVLIGYNLSMLCDDPTLYIELELTVSNRH